MPKVNNYPKALKPYFALGVDLDYKEGVEDVYGECPFCQRRKFSIHVETGKWRCLVCNEGKENQKMARGGNLFTFLNCLLQLGQRATDSWGELAKDRKVLEDTVLQNWNLAVSPLTGNWMFPGYNPNGRLVQLYHYQRNPVSKKRALYALPETSHGLHGMNLFDPNKSEVWICEGPWDAMVLWELLKRAKWSGERLSITAYEESSLYASANVIAVPGVNVFSEKWTSLLEGKKVVLLYDSDHERLHPTTNKLIPPVGYEGMKRVAQLLSRAERVPSSVNYIHWGDTGFDPDKKSGYDVRDLLTEEANLTGRIKQLEELCRRIRPIPEDWIQGRSKAKASQGKVEIQCKPCTSWKVLTNAWRKALQWSEGLDRALSVMLACIASTEVPGDQLWVKIIGPASCGKSTLCEAVSINKKYIYARSKITGFHSGYKSDKEGEEDHGIIVQVMNKTLVTKDGDTMVNSGSIGQVLSEARDIYDRTSRVSYRHGLNREYENINMTWILCGTSSLRALDSSELGERFIDCIIMEGINDDEEDDIGMRKARQANAEMSNSDEDKSMTLSPEMLEAYQLTGGYINYLRGNVRELLSENTFPDHMLRRCQRLAKFAAYVRARPSKSQDESAEREISYRLTSQLVRLAKHLAVVLNRETVDDEVMKRVRRCALDTSGGRTLGLIRCLAETKDEGMDTRGLSILTGHTEEKERTLLRFMKRIGAVEVFQKKVQGVIGSKPRWRLSPVMMKLYQEVIEDNP